MTSIAAAKLSDPTADEDHKVPLRRIGGLFLPYSGKFALLCALIVVQAGLGVASPFFLRAILDTALPRRDVFLVSLLAMGMIACSFSSGGMSIATTRMSNIIGQRVMNDLRVSVYGHLQRMSLGFFVRTRSGELLSRVFNDIGGVDNVITNTAAPTIQNLTTTLAIATALVLLDWQLAVLALLVVPLFLLLTFRVGRKQRRISRGRQRGLAMLTTMVEESLSVAGVLLSKTMGGQAAMRERFAAQSKEISELELRAALVGRWQRATRTMSLTIIPAIVYWIAGIEFANGAGVTTIGTVVAFTSMLNRLVAPASSLQSIGQNVSNSMALFGRIFEVIDLPVEVAQHEDATALHAPRGALALRGVSLRYERDGPLVLRDIDLDVPAGSTTAIVGATGSGKTSLAYLVARLYEPASGSVRIDGTDIRDVTLDSLAEHVGLVAQETYLFHDTVLANLRFAKPDASVEEIEAAARAAHIHELISGLPEGYETMVGQRGYRFSGGEKQRLAIARVLLRNPPILILDEATSALDTRTERAVQSALDELSADRTTIAIAHRLSTVRQADQIVVLEAGRIAERGSHRELLAAGSHYARLVGTGGQAT